MFQIPTRPLAEVLMGDLEKLKQMYQPMLVNEQLNQLLMEMELNGQVSSVPMSLFLGKHLKKPVLC